MLQTAKLGRYGAHPLVIARSEAVNTYTGGKIGILLAVLILKGRSDPFGYNKVVPAVCAGYITRVELFYRF